MRAGEIFIKGCAAMGGDVERRGEVGGRAGRPRTAANNEHRERPPRFRTQLEAHGRRRRRHNLAKYKMCNYEETWAYARGQDAYAQALMAKNKLKKHMHARVTSNGFYFSDCVQIVFL